MFFKYDWDKMEILKKPLVKTGILLSNSNIKQTWMDGWTKNF